jgi:hypothetical protein
MRGRRNSLAVAFFLRVKKNSGQRMIRVKKQRRRRQKLTKD